MCQPAQQLVAAVFENDRLGNHRAVPSHAIAQPFRHAATVKRQICATNVAFGGRQGRDLYITACDVVYRLSLRTHP